MKFKPLTIKRGVPFGQWLLSNEDISAGLEGSSAETEKYAHLFATAPDMHQIIEEFLAFHDKGKQPPLRLLEAARKAIED